MKYLINISVVFLVGCVTVPESAVPTEQEYINLAMSSLSRVGVLSTTWRLRTNEIYNVHDSQEYEDRCDESYGCYIAGYIFINMTKLEEYTGGASPYLHCVGMTYLVAHELGHRICNEYKDDVGDVCRDLSKAEYVSTFPDSYCAKGISAACPDEDHSSEFFIFLLPEARDYIDQECKVYSTIGIAE
jgi:hypothetical protein